jgi:hypothetical protein
MCCELLLVTVLLAADTDSLVKNIEHKEPDFDSFAEALHVIQKSGTIELSSDMPPARIVVELYREGKKLATRLESVGVGPGASEGNNDQIRFAVNLIDTDFLTLGDGKKGHCRLLMKLSIGNATSKTTLDFPKEKCDLSKMTGGGGFGPNASTKDRIPVFWMIDSRTASLISGNTPEAVIKNNPKGDLAIVYVRPIE